MARRAASPSMRLSSSEVNSGVATETTLAQPSGLMKCIGTIVPYSSPRLATLCAMTLSPAVAASPAIASASAVSPGRS